MSPKLSDKENVSDLRIVEIETEPVELYKILKFEGLVESGGQAKAVIGAGQVRVNGKTETQKRKKIVAGDRIEFRNEKFRIELAAATSQDAQDIDAEDNGAPVSSVEPLTTNDCLQDVCAILDLKENAVTAIFELVGQNVAEPQVISWLKKTDDAGYAACSDKMFLAFLDGLIIYQRGKQEGSEPRLDESLNNNVVFRKLKIAFNLHAEDILSLLVLAGTRISKQELSALFRRSDHKRYRDCEDQILRSFLQGLQINKDNAANS